MNNFDYYKDIEERMMEEEEEYERIFYQAHADADFEHWSKAAYWTLDEAVALSFGKSPEIVNWKVVEPDQEVSRFARRYALLRDLAQRAKAVERLHESVSPIMFLNWAVDNDIEFPEELACKVRSRSKLIDCKKVYEETLQAAKQTEAAYEAQITELLGQLEEARSQMKSVERSSKNSSAVERENMLKVIYAMAVRGYKHNPAAARGDAVSKIVSDLSLEGLPLSDDTVRRYLKTAGEYHQNWLEQNS